MSRGINYKKLIIAIGVCLLAGIIGSTFASSSIKNWYPSLRKPFFNPPSWIFFPVWTILYILMGISLYLVQEKGSKYPGVKLGTGIFSVQLILNTLWSIIFFRLRTPFYAFIEVIFLWITILLTILQFRKISKKASYLLIPYILWVSFAAILNYCIWVLNLKSNKPVSLK